MIALLGAGKRKKLQDSTNRIQHLDGLRGIAILLVILFHAFSRWPKIVPYGYEFKNFPLFEHGWLGVQLFFMISGFVIFMSLERSRNFHSFIIRRWIRLFPAMFICSLIIFLTASFFHERPAGIPVLRDLLPGLTFIEPYWWQVIFGSPQGELEGAFWSLYVEIKLYIVAGTFYFLIGGQRMIWVLLGLFLVAVGILFLNDIFVENGWHQAKTVLKAISGKPYGWFAAGTLFYRFYSERKRGILIAAIVTALASALAEGKTGYGKMLFEWDTAIAASIIASIFITAMLSDRVKLILSNKTLLTLGFISYPLYLLHENMMISLIVKTGDAMPWIPFLLLPVIPVSVIIGIAWLVAKFIEPPVRSKFKMWYLKLEGKGWS